MFSVEDIGSTGISKVSINVQSATISNALPFQEFLFNLINEGKLRLIVDLTNCSFVDSTFMGAMVLSLKKIMRRGGEMYLITNETMLTSTFILTGLDRVFNTYPDIKTALDKLIYE